MSDRAPHSRQYWDEGQTGRRNATHPVVREFAAPKVEYMLSAVRLPTRARVLDVGCGNGYLTHYFPQDLRTVGLDLSAAMLAQNGHRPLVQGSAADLPFEDRSFDLVLCANLLHHVEDPERVLGEMVRVSRNYVAICEPNRWNPLMLALGLAKPEERGTLRSAPKRMRTMVERAGLDLRAQRTAGFVTPTRMPPWLARVAKFRKAPSRLAAYTVVVGQRRA